MWTGIKIFVGQNHFFTSAFQSYSVRSQSSHPASCWRRGTASLRLTVGRGSLRSISWLLCFFPFSVNFCRFLIKKSGKNHRKILKGEKSEKKQRNKFWRVEKFSWQKKFFKKIFGVRKKLKEKNLQNQLKFFEEEYFYIQK